MSRVFRFLDPVVGLMDRALSALVENVSGAWIGVIAIAAYPGLGLLVPIALNWSLTSLVFANVAGVYMAAIVTLGWLVGQVEAGKRRHLVEWTTNLRQLNSEEFEWLVGELFEREGWRVRVTGRQAAYDGNIDIELTRGSVRKIVQCKRWQSWLVDVDEVRGFAGTLLREGLPGSAGIFVTLSRFTPIARSEAETAKITLVDGQDLYSRMEKVRRSELCEICQRPMRFDRSQHGWWLRCVTPGCRGKRDLGNDVGRAVEFLTEAPVAR